MNLNDSDLAGGAGPAATLTPTLTSTGQGPLSVQLPTAVADFARSEIRHHNGNRFELSGRESELLQFLASNAGRPVSRDEILRCVWHLNPRNLLTRTIDMHIAHLRDKLLEDPAHPKVLVTVRGEGYMFAAGL